MMHIGINDENGNEQIIFQTTASAVNQIDVTNAATGNSPSIEATGDDSNIDLTTAKRNWELLNLEVQIQAQFSLIVKIIRHFNLCHLHIAQGKA